MKELTILSTKDLDQKDKFNFKDYFDDSASDGSDESDDSDNDSDDSKIIF